MSQSSRSAPSSSSSLPNPSRNLLPLPLIPHLGKRYDANDAQLYQIKFEYAEFALHNNFFPIVKARSDLPFTYGCNVPGCPAQATLERDPDSNDTLNVVTESNNDHSHECALNHNAPQVKGRRGNIKSWKKDWQELEKRLLNEAKMKADKGGRGPPSGRRSSAIGGAHVAVVSNRCQLPRRAATSSQRSSTYEDDDELEDDSENEQGSHSDSIEDDEDFALSASAPKLVIPSIPTPPGKLFSTKEDAKKDLANAARPLGFVVVQGGDDPFELVCRMGSNRWRKEERTPDRYTECGWRASIVGDRGHFRVHYDDIYHNHTLKDPTKAVKTVNKVSAETVAAKSQVSHSHATTFAVVVKPPTPPLPPTREAAPTPEANQPRNYNISPPPDDLIDGKDYPSPSTAQTHIATFAKHHGFVAKPRYDVDEPLRTLFNCQNAKSGCPWLIQFEATP